MRRSLSNRHDCAKNLFIGVSTPGIVFAFNALQEASDLLLQITPFMRGGSEGIRMMAAVRVDPVGS